MVEPIRIVEAVLNSVDNNLQDLGIDLVPLSNIDQQKLDKRLNDFTEAKSRILTSLHDSTTVLAGQKDPIFAKLALVKCFGNIMDILLGSLSYSEAMALLAVATQDLSDSTDQPQDLKLDMDFYGQIESMTDQFVIDIRRVEIQKQQQEEAIFALRSEQEAIDRDHLVKIEEKLRILHDKYGEEIPSDEDEKSLMRQKVGLKQKFEKLLNLQEQMKADIVHENETRQDVLISLDEAFSMNKNILCKTRLAFNFEKCIKDIRSTLKEIGAPHDHPLVKKVVPWPIWENMKNLSLELYEQEEKLSSLRITKISWAAVDVICSLQFHFNDGSESPPFGSQVAVKESAVLADGQEVRKIAICTRQNSDYMEAMVILDQNDKAICSFKGEAVTGSWQTFQLGVDEHIIGVKGNVCDRYVRGLGVVVWKPGMGLPNYVRELPHVVIDLLKATQDQPAPANEPTNIP